MALTAQPLAQLLPTRSVSWRRLRDLILPVLQLRVARAVRRGEPVVIGSRNHPFESITDRHSLLDLLPDDRSLVIRLRCRGREVLDDLPRLIRLDRQHDLSVDWLLDHPRRLSWTRSALDAAGRLSAEGIRVRMVWRASERWESYDVENWIAEARKIKIWDLKCETDKSELRQEFEMLRLEYGFPIQSPGRG